VRRIFVRGEDRDSATLPLWNDHGIGDDCIIRAVSTEVMASTMIATQRLEASSKYAHKRNEFIKAAEKNIFSDQ
jgi:hypothetical protein